MAIEFEIRIYLEKEGFDKLFILSRPVNVNLKGTNKTIDKIVIDKNTSIEYQNENRPAPSRTATIAVDPSATNPLYPFKIKEKEKAAGTLTIEGIRGDRGIVQIKIGETRAERERKVQSERERENYQNRGFKNPQALPDSSNAINFTAAGISSAGEDFYKVELRTPLLLGV
ncbi:hypothetical protein C1645_819525 [Glomus cerebriforme]|uniref:Uncharacterized protein n=1 Tax=Glomus cerebriforme TaxID=658196 RepID=A0A397TAQ1_9GLOM|nr:hypothetical protein C1645_819525 [Glomus cerebriforme]